MLKRVGFGDASSLAIQNSVQLYGGQSLPDIGRGDFAHLQASAQSYLDQQTTPAATDARETRGTVAAASLIANGYDPNNDADNQLLVSSIAGGLCLIPAIGPVLGAVLMAMYEVGVEVIAPAVDKLFGYSSVPTCSSTGNPTAALMLSLSGISTTPPTGTLAGLIVPAYGKAFLDLWNCNTFNHIPRSVPFGFQVLAGPLLQMWNKNTSGALIDYFVPCINASDWPMRWANFGVSGPLGSGGGPGSNLVYGPFLFGNGTAPGPGGEHIQAQGAYAFQPLSQVPASVADPSFEGLTWMRIAANSAHSSSSRIRGSRNFTVHLNLAPGPGGGASPAPPAPAVSPIASTVAKTTVLTLGGVTLATLLYSWAIGKSAGFVLDKLWDGTKALFNTSVGEAREVVGGVTSNPLLVGASNEGTAVQTLLFSRKTYTPASAKSWAHSHGYRSSKVDVTANNIRLRQAPPGKFRRLRTVRFSPGIQAVVGWTR
jgi:hypothetical protein